MNDKDEKKSFWTTLPGILTGITGLITALGGLFVILHQIGVLGPGSNRPAVTGAILIASKPSRAQVVLDGQPMGSTSDKPLALKNLEPRAHSLRLTKEGYEPWEQSVEVVAGQEQSLVAHLDRATASNPAPPAKELGGIFIQSIPPVVNVFLDGRLVGATSEGHLALRNLEAKQYSLRVMQDGYLPNEQSVEVKPGQVQSVMARLRPAPPKTPGGPGDRDSIRAMRATDRSPTELEVWVDYSYSGERGVGSRYVYMSAVALQSNGTQVPRTHFEGLGGPGEVNVGDGTTQMLIKKYTQGRAMSTSVKVCIVARNPSQEVICKVFPFTKAWM